MKTSLGLLSISFGLVIVAACSTTSGDSDVPAGCDKSDPLCVPGTGGQATVNPGSGGFSATGGSANTGGFSATGGAGGEGCARPDLEWKSGRKTNYTSYPEPGSEECIVYNGCMWAGWFAGCNAQQTKEWVQSHNIAALFPGFGDYALHDICIRSGEKTMVVTVYDTCGDSDCNGCCTNNKGQADALVDLESFTNARWGLPDGAIEWADLGPSPDPGCTGY